jgi:hypothetical protein
MDRDPGRLSESDRRVYRAWVRGIAVFYTVLMLGFVVAIVFGQVAVTGPGFAPQVASQVASAGGSNGLTPQK